MTYGSHGRDMTRNYPDISIQSAITPSSWWIEEDSKGLQRGRLIRAFLPHVDQVPYTLIPIGRAQATEHKEVTVRIEPLRIKKPRPHITLPVAGMPPYPGEVRIVQRAKKRPALVLGLGGFVLPEKCPGEDRDGKCQPRFLSPLIMAESRMEQELDFHHCSSTGFAAVNILNS